MYRVYIATTQSLHTTVPGFFIFAKPIQLSSTLEPDAGYPHKHEPDSRDITPGLKDNNNGMSVGVRSSDEDAHCFATDASLSPFASTLRTMGQDATSGRRQVEDICGDHCRWSECWVDDGCESHVGFALMSATRPHVKAELKPLSWG